METAAPSLEAQPLQSLRGALADGEADPGGAIAAVVEAGLAEEAADLVRSARREGIEAPRRKAFLDLLEPAAVKAQARREAGWHLDSRRVCVRIGYEKVGDALDFDDGDLHAILLQAFRLEGLRLALDLGKRPKPQLRIALPLPPGAGGREEWLESVLRPEPSEAPDHLMARINRRLPGGLGFRRWEVHPSYASPLSDLAESFRWRWRCPPDRLAQACARTEAFLASSEWIWEKEGRVEGRKQVKPLDLRPQVRGLVWEGDLLSSVTSAGEAGATNPLRLHAAILGLDPVELWGLTRSAIIFREDPRLALGERFEPKLKNIYEDAVLLAGGSHIILVDEDDDEPLRLG